MIEIDVQSRRKGIDAPEADTPFRILILGDFGCQTPKPVLVNRDNLDLTIKKLGVSVELPQGGRIGFEQLEDFHPDELCRRVPLFQTLRDAKKKAHEPDVKRIVEAAKPATEDILRAGSLLDMAVAQSEGAPKRAADPFLDYVERLVAPYTVAKPDPKQEQLMQRLEAAMAGNLRAILQSPDFQALEAAWRGVDFVTRSVDDDVAVKIFIYSVSKTDLAAELNAASDLRQTSLFRFLVEQAVATPGAPRWSVVAGNYLFGPDDASDVELLGRIALIASVAGAPFIAGGTPDPNVWLETPEYWRQLASIPEASFLAIALPRFLLRLPYGAKSSSIESFAFEEMQGSEHNSYLWGNPAFAILRLIIEDFSEEDWRMTPGRSLDLTGLPAHVYEEDGEKVLKPCAELLLTQDVAEKLMEKGLMPLLSLKNSDRAHLAGYRAINGGRLAGPWN
jgi:type VI secretion system protein ImpC